MYRGAIIGCGSVACQGHIPVWRQASFFQIVAAVDPAPAHRARAQALLPGIRCYEHLETLFDHEELDFVDICTPPAMHDRIILEACTRGVHTLCEKPLTFSSTAFQQIVAAAAAAGVLVFSVHNWKYAPHLQALKCLLIDGEISLPTYIELTTLRTHPAGASGWRLDPRISGGGILMDHGWHAFYLLLFLLDESPQEIAASLENRRLLQAEVEDTATCEVTFPRAQTRIHLTWAAQRRCNLGIIRGEKGEIRLEDTHLVVHKNGHGRREIYFPEALSAGSYHADWFASLLADFHTALRKPQQYDTSLRESQTCLNLMLLAYRSAGLNAKVLPYSQTHLVGTV